MAQIGHTLTIPADPAFRRVLVGCLTVASVLLGVLAVREPSLALALAAAIAVMAVLARHSDRPLEVLLPVMVILLAGLVDLPRRVGIGSFTLLALVTLGLALAALPVWLIRDSRRSVLPLITFPLGIWILLSAIAHPPSITGIQNILVFFVFISILELTASFSRYNSGSHVGAALAIATLCASILYGITIISTGALGSTGLVSARAFGLFGLVSLAWYLPRCHYKETRTYALVASSLSMTLIVASLSRTAFVVAVILVGLNWLITGSGGLTRRLLPVAAAMLLGIGAFLLVDPLQERFVTGDVQSVGGGVQFNVSGRFDIWGAVWDSYRTEPITGLGAGTSETLTYSIFGESASHPHNDYLRILHDFGLIGFILWVVFLITLTIRTARAWRAENSSSDAAIHGAAFLSLVAVLLSMGTDNTIVYIGVVGPVAVIVGTSLGQLGRARSGIARDYDVASV